MMKMDEEQAPPPQQPRRFAYDLEQILPSEMTDEEEGSPVQFVTAFPLDDLSTLGDDTVTGRRRGVLNETTVVATAQPLPNSPPPPPLPSYLEAPAPKLVDAEDTPTKSHRRTFFPCLPGPTKRVFLSPQSLLNDELGRDGCDTITTAADEPERRRLAIRRFYFIALFLGPLLLGMIIGLIWGLVRFRENTRSFNQASSVVSPGITFVPGSGPIDGSQPLLPVGSDSAPSSSPYPSHSPAPSSVPTSIDFRFQSPNSSPSVNRPATVPTLAPVLPPTIPPPPGPTPPPVTPPVVDQLTKWPHSELYSVPADPAPTERPTLPPTPRSLPPTERPTLPPTPRPLPPTERPTLPPTPRPLPPTERPTLRPTPRPLPPTEQPTLPPTPRPTPRPTIPPVVTLPPFPEQLERPYLEAPTPLLVEGEASLTLLPSNEPTVSSSPSSEPSSQITSELTDEPSPAPSTAEPVELTDKPTPAPSTAEPVELTDEPTPAPSTAEPTSQPEAESLTANPTGSATLGLTSQITSELTDEPTPAPTFDETDNVSNPPTGIPYPFFRYVPWIELDVDTQTLAMQMGYDEESWNLPGQNPVEAVPYRSLPSQHRAAMVELGFTGSSWDCWINHYFGYNWGQLEESGVVQYYETLGWSPELWNDKKNPMQLPGSDRRQWRELSAEEQRAADQLCYTRELWDEVGIPN